MNHHTIVLLAFATCAATTLAQTTNIDATHKYTWSENCGWMNWRDAGSPAGAQGAVINPTFLSGFVWMENAGFLNLGDGTPVNGVAYSNTNGTDTGVNIQPTGNLAGLAWGENIGWINFDTAAALTASGQQARLASGRLRGYAWGENIGWINLDDTTSFVAPVCYANCDRSTAAPVLNANDFQCFLNNFAAANPYANCDGSTATPILNANDFQCFLNRFAAGCS